MVAADFCRFNYISLYRLSLCQFESHDRETSRQISPIKDDNFLLIYLSGLHLLVSDSFGLRFVLQARPLASAFYLLPVRQTEILP